MKRMKEVEGQEWHESKAPSGEWSITKVEDE